MKLGLQIAAWIIFVVIVAMTVGPLGLRPESPLPANWTPLIRIRFDLFGGPPMEISVGFDDGGVIGED